MPDTIRRTTKNDMLNQNDDTSMAVYIGRVAEDRKPESRKIKVYVKDLLPFYKGKLAGQEAQFEIGGLTHKGSVTATNVLEAEWMGDDSNRRFPPDVKVNEQVEVIVYANQDKVYWRSKGRDDNKRRTERMELSVANTPDGPQDLNNENTYGITIDTRDGKAITISTSKSAGEQFAYIIKIDAANGKITIADDSDNEIVIESGVPRVYLKNKDGALVELAKKNVTVIAPDDLMLKAGRQAVLDIPALKMVNTNNAGVTSWESGEIHMKSASMIIEAPCIGLKGHVEADSIVSGPHHATGYSTFSGGMRAANIPAQFAAVLMAIPPAVQNTASITARASSGFSTYRTPWIDIINGTAGTAGNTPNLDGGGGVNRHCTAWEDISSAIAKICDELTKIDAKIGYGASTGGIMADASSSIMYKNTGE